MNIFTKYYHNKLMTKVSKYLSLYSNSPKTVALKLIFWNLKFVFSRYKSIKTFNDNLQHIAIEILGGIGDQIIGARYVEALSHSLSENVKIDILCEAQDLRSLQTIFCNKTFINSIQIDKKQIEYDLKIRLIRFPIVLSYLPHRLDENTLRYVQQLEEFNKKHSELFGNDYLARCWSLMNKQTRIDQADFNNYLHLSELDFVLNITEDYKAVLDKFNLSNTKFITIQTGAGYHFQNIKNEVRSWPIGSYNQLVKMLKKKYPQYKLVQIGEQKQSKIDGLDIDLRGKTSLEELFVLLKYASLHVSQEGGMPIIRHFVKGGISVVLFGPTDENFIGFEENINISNRKCFGVCEWINQDWVRKCAHTGNNAECMQNITPEMIMNKIQKCGVLK